MFREGESDMGESLPQKQGKAGQQLRKRMTMTMSAWLSAFKASWQTVLRIDRSSLTPFQALRSTLGIGIPLVLGIVTGQVETGVLVASGALLLGSVGLKDPYRR